MSNRIRSHVLEERSIAFLRDIFPDTWAIHSFIKDYGIDIQVEVFAENGDRTGIRFYGQVKATDKNISNDRLSLDRSHFEYWSGHTDPVLLLRYFDTTKELRWCWLHDVSWLIKSGNDSLDVAGLLKTWDVATSPTQVEKYLHARRQALFEPLTPPYEITIEQLDGNDLGPIIAAKIASAVNSKSFKVLPREMAMGNFQLVFAPTKIASSYSGLPGFVFHHENDLTEDELVEHALFATFLCACRYERILFARSLASVSAPLLYRAAGKELRPQFFDAMIFSLGLMQAVEIITPLLKDEDDPSLPWLMFSTTCAASSWRYGEAHSWAALLRQWLECPPIPENAGPFAYNLGNSLAQQGKWDEACEAYSIAIAKDSAYDNRSYFWGEFGAANFETGNFEEASRCYEKALRLEDSPENRWRLGDTLFHAGQFANASEQLQMALPEVGERNRTYVELVLLVCNELCDLWNLESQTASAIEECDHEVMQLSTTSMNEVEIVAHLRPLMNKNAIDARLNFNAGVFANRNGHYLIAGYRFLTCALRQRGDAEAWINSIICALNSGNAHLAILSAKAAHFFVGEEFLPWALGMMPSSPQIPAQMADSWRALITELIESFEQDRTVSEETPILRVHTPNGTQVLHLGNS
ncbi:DUF4365 domain-containing protein [Methylophilus sp. YYY-1]|uniref:DUF4365 domain-containing protein n=1 Tax=Methylophilus sp. YYY-1 TaxID=2682087 RepID=UPI0023B31FBC|nr:DUF4365 domain-containing protein [Methylophilus sp. YYY-1]MDF0378697.1 DUF4365 domain-containing protein [Methylophilus sp. YYY-1]